MSEMKGRGASYKNMIAPASKGRGAKGVTQPQEPLGTTVRNPNEGSISRPGK